MSSTVIFVEVKSFTSGFVKRVSKTIKCGGESGNFEVEDKWEPLYPLAEFKIRGRGVCLSKIFSPYVLR